MFETDTMLSGVGTVAVVGCGLIGISWAACYLGKGYDVIATDPATGAEERLRKKIVEFGHPLND